MKTVKTNVYEIKELSEGAKTKAIENYRYSDRSSDTVNFLIDNEIDYLKDELIEKVGFYKNDIHYMIGSQGQGACFQPEIENFEKIINTMILCSSDNLSHYLLILELYKKGLFLYDFEKVNHNYDHEKTYKPYFYYKMDISFTSEFLTILLEDFEKEFSLFYQNLCLYIFKCLETEYNYFMKDKAVIEEIEAQELFFYESGIEYIEN